MHWSLDTLHALTQEDYDELLAWALKKSEKTEDGSMDMDAVIDAKAAKSAKDTETDG
jgi:hypothetical protein